MNDYRKGLPKEFPIGINLPIKIIKDERKSRCIAFGFTFGLFVVILLAATAASIVVFFDQ